MIVIKTARLGFSYQNIPILHGVTLEIYNKEFIGIIGPNGGGKTTLLKLLMGLLTPCSGTIRIFGCAPKCCHHHIGYVPQNRQTDRDFPITVLELIMLGALENRSFYPSWVKRKAYALIEELGLEEHHTKAFSSLSGGLAQKALFARALLCDPDILLLDEPTANIDPYSKEVILRKLDDLKGRKTILLVTHDLQTIHARVDKVLCVQSQVTALSPDTLCEHISLGLYHPPVPEKTTTHRAYALR